MIAIILLCLFCISIHSAGSTYLHYRGSRLVKLQRKFQSSRIPIFEFRDEVNQLIDEGEGVIELENTFYEYLDSLHDSYLKEFQKDCSTYPTEVAKLKEKTMVEYTAAVHAAIPNSLANTWSADVCCFIQQGSIIICIL